ncbi:MAG: CPBP family glutamic-type intramembrane protease [Anaerolineales bacterium]
MDRLRSFLGTPAGSDLIVGLSYLAMISIAEAITTLVEPQLGMVLHGLVLVMLLLHGSLTHRGVLRRFLILLSISPLIRIVSLSLPLQKIGLPLIYWYLVIGVLLFLAAFIASRVTDLRGSRISWTWGVWPQQLGIGLIGFGLGYMEFMILKPGPLAAYVTWVDVVTAALILMVFTGVLEEYIFRGLMQSATMQMMGRFGLIYVALLFAVLHLGYHSLIDVLFVLMVGLLFGWLVWKTQSLLGVSLAHGIANISLYVIFPVLISSGSLPVASLEPTPIPEATPAPLMAITPATGTVAWQDVITVDDGDPGFVYTGTNLWLDLTRGYNGKFRWTYAAQSAPNVVATWVPPLSRCGGYFAEAFIPTGTGLTPSAAYTVNHRSGTTAVVVNQTSVNGTWIALGFFEFAPGTSANIQLSNGTGDDPKLLRWVAFDAIRWTFQSDCSAAAAFPIR